MALTKTMAQTHNSPTRPKFFGRIGNNLSRLGKALMFPIAMLPVAAILLRIGSAIPVDTEFSKFVSQIITVGGSAIFDNLAMLFAIGLAFGLSKDSRGEAAIVAFVCMTILIMTMSSGGVYGGSGMDLVDKIYGGLSLGDHPGISGFHDIFTTWRTPEAGTTGAIINGWQVTRDSYNAILANNVLNGIVVGSLVAFLYNKFKAVEMPQILGFFSGRRLVPIISVLTTLIFVLLWAMIFPWIGYVIYELSDALGRAQGNRFSNAGIMFAYGILNRLLIPFGLHNVPNTLFWFTFGQHPDAAGNLVYGDINIFLNGVAAGNHAGTFQSGFFVIFMFGLPALVYAIYKCAEDKEKAKVIGLLGGSALISFFTGITEPIEFAFLYAAPLLFLAHAILTGFFAFIVGLFGIQLGFGFSAGFIDYVLSIPKSMAIIDANKTGINAVMANPAWIWVIGIVCAFTYYYVSKFIIRKWNVATPGRQGNYIVLDLEARTGVATTKAGGDIAQDNKYIRRSQLLLQGMGGPQNVETMEWCATRLRLILKDRSLVDQTMLKMGGSQGNVNVGASGLQVIMGPMVEQYGDVINAIMGGKIAYQPTHDISQVQDTTEIKPVSRQPIALVVQTPIAGQIMELAKVKDEVFSKATLGKGIGIMPRGTKVYAPFDGTMETVFPTGHAYGITSTEGVQVLIHIGLDTVNAGGKGFKTHVKQGQKVKQGDLLGEVNLTLLKKAGYELVTPVVLLKGPHAWKMTAITTNKEVKKGDTLFIAK